MGDYHMIIPAPSLKLSITISSQTKFMMPLTSFEKILYCKKCFDGSILRDGECVPASIEAANNRKDYYDYSCESAC